MKPSRYLQKASSASLRTISVPNKSSGQSRLHNPSNIFVTKFPGTRSIELTAPSTGNLLKPDVTSKISHFIDMYQNNNTIAAIFFVSKGMDDFSIGFEQDMTLESLKKAHELSSKISESKTCTLSVYNGNVRASPYGVFAASKYRLGYFNTRLTIPELREKNNFPFGGVAYRLVSSCPEGLVMARYLGLTGKGLGIDSLLSLGWISHLVEPDPQISFADALIKTRPESLETKKWQGDLVDAGLIDELFEAMGPNVDIEIDINDPILNSLAAPLQPIDYLPADPSLCDDTFLNEYASLDYCFQIDSLIECEKRLKKFVSNDGKDNWAKQAINAIKGIDAAKFKSWLDLTRLAKSKGNIHDVFKYEIDNFEVSFMSLTFLPVI